MSTHLYFFLSLFIHQIFHLYIHTIMFHEISFSIFILKYLSMEVTRVCGSTWCSFKEHESQLSSGREWKVAIHGLRVCRERTSLLCLALLYGAIFSICCCYESPSLI
jgi:hypothetical protein